jgi:hypothetical protein
MVQRIRIYDMNHIHDMLETIPIGERKSIRACARLLGIPRSTMHKFVKKVHPTQPLTEEEIALKVQLKQQKEFKNKVRSCVRVDRIRYRKRDEATQQYAINTGANGTEEGNDGGCEGYDDGGQQQEDEINHVRDQFDHHAQNNNNNNNDDGSGWSGHHHAVETTSPPEQQEQQQLQHQYQRAGFAFDYYNSLTTAAIAAYNSIGAMSYRGENDNDDDNNNNVPVVRERTTFYGWRT